MASIDLSNAFFSIPLHKDSKKFCSFEFKGNKYNFNILPFGPTSSPRIFTKIIEPIISHLRSKNIKVFAYLDDIFLCVQSQDILKIHVNIVINLLNDLGFYVYFEKSSIVPSHTLVHLGYIWNSLDMSISLPSDKMIKTMKFVYYLIHNECSLREISSFLGLVVSHSSAFKFSPLLYSRIQLRSIDNVKQGKDYNDLFSFDFDSLDDLP